MYYKLTSRKFWVSVITILSGVMGLLSVKDDAINTICNGLLVLIPTVVYVITEGKIDKEGVKSENR